MIDLVTPHKNEKEFVKMAEKLKYDELCFAYDFKGKKEFNSKEKLIEKLQKNTKIKLYAALISLPKNYSECKNISSLALMKGSADNAIIIPQYRPDVLFELENLQQKDFNYTRNSGLNNVICGLASKNKTVIGYSLAVLKDSRKMGRLKQNIKLCRKHKVSEAVFSFARTPYEMRNPNDLISLFIVLGMNPGEAKKSLNALSEKIKENIEKKKPGYVGEGVRVVD